MTDIARGTKTRTMMETENTETMDIETINIETINIEGRLGNNKMMMVMVMIIRGGKTINEIEMVRR